MTTEATPDPVFARPHPIGSAAFEASSFSCGHPSLDEWIRSVAARAEGRTARTYVVTTTDGRLAAYYCLATGSVARIGVPRRLRKDAPDPIPVAIIGRLAVASEFGGRGIGSGLLQDASRRIVQIAETIGCAAIVAHAIDEAASTFYRRCGFDAFPDGTRTMFLPIATLTATID